MARCQVCGKEYDRAFQVKLDEQLHEFDSLKCAMQALGRTCSHCGRKFILPELETEGSVFCSARCASQAKKDAQDPALRRASTMEVARKQL